MSRFIVSKLTESGLQPSPDLFIKTSQKACSQWSPLKVKGDENCAGFALKLKRRYLDFDNKSHAKKNKPDLSRELTIQDSLNRMRDDWENDLRNPTLMMRYMDVLREHRLLVVTKEAASDHLRLYPALRLPSVLSEFEVKAETNFEQMKTRWTALLPQLIKAMVEDNLFHQPDTDDIDLLTVKALQFLHQVKVWYKEKKDRDGNIVIDRKCYILELFPEGTPVKEIWSSNRDPPRLMAVEKPDGGKVSLFCFVDTTPLFSVENAVEALCLLIGTFYAFDIQFTPKAKFSLYLLVSALIGSESVITKFSNNSKYVAFLRKIGIDI